MQRSLSFYAFIVVCLVGVTANNGIVTLEASNCEDLRDILENVQTNKRIVITKNMRCDRQRWPSTVFATHHTIIEGSTFGKGVPAIDWGDFINAIVVSQAASMTIRNVVLIQDFVRLGGLKLGFIFGFDDAKINILGVGVGIRSCEQPLDSLIPIYDNIPRPGDSREKQQLSERSSVKLFVDNAAFAPPRGDNATWTICNSVYQCAVNSPFDKDFQKTLNRESLIPTCQMAELNGEEIDDDDVSSGSTSSAAFAAIVAIFTALCTTLVLVAVYVVFRVAVLPLIRKKKSKKSDEEQPPPDPHSETEKPKTRSLSTTSIGLLTTPMQLTDIELGVPLGKGTMGTVYKGYHNDKPLAIKVVDVEASEAMLSETDPVGTYLAQHRHHPNVTETILYQTHRMEEAPGESTSRSGTPRSAGEIAPAETFPYRTFHVMEFCNLGSLEKAMVGGTFRNGDQLKLLTVLRSALDIAKGMKYLHSSKIVHGQLRPSNILLKGDAMDARGFICKVSDFGLTHLREKQQALEITQGRHISFRAPETLRKGTIETGSDVFAFGMVMWTMLSSKLPFEGLDAAETVAAILEGTRPTIPSIAPRKYERLIKDCWHADKSARPPFEIVIERLGKIITEIVRSPDSTPKHRRRRGTSSSTEGETNISGSGSVKFDPLFDILEIRDANSEKDDVRMTSSFVVLGTRSPSMSNGSAPFWDHFQSAASSPLSPQSNGTRLSMDLSESGHLPWEVAEEEIHEELKPRRTHTGSIASKPSETVSLKFGMAADSGESDKDTSSSNHSASKK